MGLVLNVDPVFLPNLSKRHRNVYAQPPERGSHCLQRLWGLYAYSYVVATYEYNAYNVTCNVRIFILPQWYFNQ